jgi:hypothetical protein
MAIKTGALTGSILTSSNPLKIGEYSSTYNFHGLIDDVRIYDAALSSSDIQQHYAEEAPKHGIVLDN